MPPNYQPGMSIFDLVRQTNPQSTGGELPFGFQRGAVGGASQMPPAQVQQQYGQQMAAGNPPSIRELIAALGPGVGRPGMPQQGGMPPGAMPQQGAMPPGGMPQRGPVNAGAVIDRFEGDKAVVFIDSGEQLVVPRMSLPPGIQAGARLRVLTDGNRIFSAMPDNQPSSAIQGLVKQMNPRVPASYLPQYFAEEGYNKRMPEADALRARQNAQTPVQPFVPSDQYRRMR